ncbi:hypothetical protein UY3_03355 [Chelonia mydas]|uniref:Uncharacterized protein n=1 Tax=Chelonia mydas TaxID=8469 RepID=M7BQC7_CHEMY|nr:hypothetical protein UY3_03355 [Chelonia mydas]
MGAARSGGQHIPWPTPLPAVPIGLEQSQWEFRSAEPADAAGQGRVTNKIECAGDTDSSPLRALLSSQQVTPALQLERDQRGVHIVKHFVSMRVIRKSMTLRTPPFSPYIRTFFYLEPYLNKYVYRFSSSTSVSS